ncbi:MAG: TetR family transcriptional regulator [Hyphomonadaceae bacterium]|nr:TetR family transcriptional regulator [Hyphomonadaceae bacterium]
MRDSNQETANLADGSLSIRATILDVAERIICDEGYQAASVRKITREAGVNVAAVNYYFGSKLGLVKALLSRHAEPINAERLSRLSLCRENLESGQLGTSQVLAAFIEPTLRGPHFKDGGRAYRRLLGKISVAPMADIRVLLATIYDGAALEFADLLGRLHPALDRREFFWRLSCVFGVMTYILADNASARLEDLSGGEFDMGDADAALRYAIPFLSSGLCAPAGDADIRGAQHDIDQGTQT